jgi:short-subunit dehydrogenase
MTVLVTGATAGIGRAAALLLAEKGHRVFATGRREERLRELEEEAANRDLEGFVLDVTDPSSRESAAALVAEKTDGQGLHALVNNAGYGLSGPVEEIDLDDLRRQFETNVFGLVALTQAFLPAMRRRGSGTIVNVSSIVGRISVPLQGAYNATKFALEALSDALRREVRQFGIRVAIIEPGAIVTEFGDVYRGHLDRAARPESPYHGALETVRKSAEKLYAKAPGPACVARAIAKAVESRRPRIRYVVPWWPNRLLLASVAALPTSWVDAGMRKSLGLRRRE